MLPLADQRVGEQRLARVGRVARDRGLGGQPLVGRDVLDEPEQLRRQRRLGERLGPGPRMTRAGTSTTSSGGSPAIVPPLRTSTTWTSPLAGASERDQRRRRLAVEGAAALLEQRRLGRQRRVAVQLQQLALDLGHLAARGVPRALLGEHLVVGVEVAQVVRGHRAELVEQPPRQRRRARPARSPWPASSRAARPRRRGSTARTQVRWLRPTWSTTSRSGSTPSSAAHRRWKPIATLHSPTARWPSSSSARVTIPTGLVKSTIQASGAASSRARSAISSTTGTVRIALAKPPAPVVSCPMQPHGSGTVSSREPRAPGRRRGSGSAPRPRRRAPGRARR